MRIIVIADTHKNSNAMHEIFERNQSADIFIFLGDGEREFQDICCLYPHKKAYSVCGNCDYSSFSSGMGVIEVEKCKIIFLHGHSHGVKGGINEVLRLARENDAQIILFGHTHQRFYQYIDGIHMLNPGSASSPRDGKPPSFAFIDITKAGIVTNHVDV